MPRRPRLSLPNVPLHIIQRGNNRQACFFADEDYRCYLYWLAEYANKSGCRVHAYVLMTNHVHLLISINRADAAGALMKTLGQRYVQYINLVYQRSGTLWEGRFRSCLIQEETYLLACQRYIELNPVWAGMVAPGCRCHPLHVAGTDAATATRTVAMLHLTRVNDSYCLEAAVRVLADTQALLCWREFHRAGVIQQQERADKRPQFRIGKQRAHWKTVADPVMRRVTLDREEFFGRFPGISCWHGLSPSYVERLPPMPDGDEFRLEFQANFFTPAFFAAFCKSSSSVASGMPSLNASSR